MKILVLALVLAAVAAGSATAAPASCGTLSVRAGTSSTGATAGPACLLKAFRTCKAAQFTLSNVGVDTVSTDVFNVVRMDGGCRVKVAATFRVVPQSPHTLAAVCSKLVSVSGDTVASRCTGALGTAISLTGKQH